MMTMNAMGIYVLKAGLRYGPYSLSELQEQVEQGFFTEADFASSAENQTWVPITKLPGLAPRTYTVQADQAHNLLVIRYRDRVEAAAVEACLLEVKTALEKLEPGFQLLADFTTLEAMELACVPFVEKIMKVCNQKGVSRVVRVMPDPKRDIGLQIMSFFHYNADVRVVTCPTMEEAQARLAEY